MNIHYNYRLTGDERKVFVQTISEILGKPAVYQRAPTFAYAIDFYTVDKTGVLSYPENAGLMLADQLISQLRERGYVPEPTALTVEVPRAGLSEEVCTNIKKIVASKAGLIKKAIRTDTLEIEVNEETLRFPWFTLRGEAGEADAYLRLIHAVCEMAKRQKRVTARESEVVNEKFAMRVFLIRLGFIGEAYSTARKLLLKNLTGNGSWKAGHPPVRNMTNTSATRIVQPAMVPDNTILGSFGAAQRRRWKMYSRSVCLTKREVNLMRNNSGFPSRETVERIRNSYPTGCRVELISMDDPYSRLKPGDQGTVRLVDDTGTVFVNWDCGSGLGIVYGVDQIRKL